MTDEALTPRPRPTAPEGIEAQRKEIFAVMIDTRTYRERAMAAEAEVVRLRAELSTTEGAVGDEEVQAVLDSLGVVSCDRERSLIKRLSVSLRAAEKERDEARAGKLQAVQAANATGEFALGLDKRRHASEAALSLALAERDRAREAALEEAAKAIERGWVTKEGHHVAADPGGAARIRALKEPQ